MSHEEKQSMLDYHASICRRLRTVYLLQGKYAEAAQNLQDQLRFNAEIWFATTPA
jgi:hypothetical protein